MRETSLKFMITLFDFSPYLIGEITKGVVGLSSKLQINIFCSNQKKDIPHILEKENDIFLKKEIINQNAREEYDDVVIFEDFGSGQNFEVFIYNDQNKFNDFLEYNSYWNIYKLAKTVNKLNILNNFEEKRNFEYE